ncbi:MAG: hypothetical protein HYR84_07665 [Planctomycetes bacterium]|nr:hypothetical protein [Planctomycetota bacterium]
MRVLVFADFVRVVNGYQLLKFGADAKITLDLTLDACIDGSSENGIMKLKMVMSGTATIPDAPGAMATLHVGVDATQTQQDATKK